MGYIDYSIIVIIRISHAYIIYNAKYIQQSDTTFYYNTMYTIVFTSMYYLLLLQVPQQLLTQLLAISLYKKIHKPWESADNNTQIAPSGPYKKTNRKKRVLRDKRAQRWYRPSETKNKSRRPKELERKRKNFSTKGTTTMEYTRSHEENQTRRIERLDFESERKGSEQCRIISELWKDDDSMNIR